MAEGVIPAGVYPAELVAACKLRQVEPGELLAWSVRQDEVVLLLPSWERVRVPVTGEWTAEPAAGQEPPPKPAKKKAER